MIRILYFQVFACSSLNEPLVQLLSCIQLFEPHGLQPVRLPCPTWLPWLLCCTWLLEKPQLWLYGTLLVKWCLCFLIHCLGFEPRGLQPSRLLCSWNSPSKNTGVGSHSLLQRIFLAQGSNLHLLHCRQIFFFFFFFYHLNHHRSPVSLLAFVQTDLSLWNISYYMPPV